MEDNVRAKENQPKKKLSYLSLIKLLIVEKLRRLGKTWDSFLLLADIPRDPKGDSPLPTGKVTSHHVEAEEGKTLEALSPQHSIPRKGGRPRKNKEIEEFQVLSKPHAKSTVEELIMHAIQLEPIEGPSRETCGRRRRPDTECTDIHELSQ
jgi:hypothetical protein